MVARIAFKVVLVTSTVAKITFVVTKVTFKWLTSVC